MRILLDLQGAQTVSRTRGIGRYTMSLARALIREAGEHEIWVGMTSGLPQSIGPVKEALADVLPEERMLVWSTVTPTGDMNPEHDGRLGLAQVVREAFLNDLGVDLVHCSSVVEGAEENSVTSINRHFPGTTTAATLYDLIPMLDRRYIEDPDRERWYRRRLAELRRADLLLAISDSSRREGLEVLGLPADRLCNIRTAADDVFVPLALSADGEAQIRHRFGIPRPFLMYSGGVDARKNLPALIDAFADLPATLRREHQLVLVGSGAPGINDDLVCHAQSRGLSGNDMVMTGFVSDEELVALYNLATAFVFPSQHEGFGLPPLEAMSCGTPTIAANNSSLPEVVGNPEALFATDGTAPMTAMMRRVLTDAAFRAELGRLGLEQAKTFSWNDSARRALRAFEHAVESRPPRPVATATVHRPRLAFVTGLPAKPSPVREQLVHLVEQLDHDYEVDLVVDQDLDPWDFEGPARVVRATEFNVVSGRYDRIVHHMANSPEYACVREMVLRHPGTLLVDDYFLDRVPYPVTEDRDAISSWAQAVVDSDGYQALHRLLAARASAVPTDRVPLNAAVLGAANGVMVTDPRIVELARAEHGEDYVEGWVVVPPLVVGGLIDPARHAARSAVASFGDGAAHRHHRVVAAWARSRLSAHPDAELLIVGQDPHSPYGRLLAAMLTRAGRPAAWRIVPAHDAAGVIGSVRVVVDLSTAPDSATASWLHDCASRGTTIVRDPESNVAQGDTLASPALVDALREGWEIGGRQQAPVVPVSSAESYRAAIEHFHRCGPFASEARTLRVAGRQPGITSDDWEQTALAVRRNTRPAVRERQLLLDLSTLVSVDARTGIQRVVRSLASSLMLAPPEGFRTEPVYCDSDGEVRYARRFGAAMMGLENSQLVDDPVVAASRDAYVALDLNDRLFPMASPDTTESVMGPAIERLRSKGVSCQAVVYDILPVRHPEWFAWPEHWFRNYVSHLARRFDGLVCISESTARDVDDWIRDNEPGKAPAIDWFHLGADIENSVPSTFVTPGFERRWAQRGPGPSILMVGTVEPRKGHDQAVEAFAEIWRRGVDVNLVIVGHDGWGVDSLVTAMREHPDWNERLIWFKGASDAELLELYRQADGCLMASRGEGFGLPLIEAARYDIPVLARDIEVFREVGGNHVSYFSGEEPAELADSIIEWVARLADGTAPRSGDIGWLTWDQSATQFVEALRRNLAN